MANFGLKSFPLSPSIASYSTQQSGLAGGSNNAGQAGTTFTMKAGVDCPAGALMCIGADGLGYPAQTADYAVKPNMLDSMIAATTVTSNAPAHYDRMNLLQAANGDIIVATSYYSGGSPYGIALYRYNASGALQGSVLIDSVNTTCYDPHMALLSNGNIVVSWCDTANLRFAVVTQALAVVKPATSVDALGSSVSYLHNMIALSGGGFMLSWQDKNTLTNYNVAVYDNLGAVVTPKAVIRTVTGSAVHTRSAQLSNGNVAMLITANNLSYIGVLSPLGAVVVSFAPGDPLMAAALDVNALPGYFAVVGKEYNGSGLKMRVYANDGTQQGATALLTCVAVDLGGARIANDGINFWITYNTTNVIHSLSRVTVAAAVTTWTLDPNANVGTGANFDMFYERGRLVIHKGDGNGSSASFSLIVFNVKELVVDSKNNDSVLSNAATNLRARMIPGGDFTVIIGGVSSYTTFFAFRYSAASIVGVSAAAVEAGGKLSVYALPGTYGVGALKGSPSKAFDHSTAAIPGNKGNLLNYGVVLKGY